MAFHVALPETDRQGSHLKKLPLTQLPKRHRDVVAQAVSNVLATESAELTFAQIIEGVPLSEIEKDSYEGSLSYQHPLHTQHAELGPGVLETMQQLRRDFDGSNLSFTPKASPSEDIRDAQANQIYSFFMTIQLLRSDLELSEPASSRWLRWLYIRLLCSFSRCT